MVRNSASPITRTPSEFAFVSFEPASAPAITADVFFDTLDDTFPPARLYLGGGFVACHRGERARQNECHAVEVLRYLLGLCTFGDDTRCLKRIDQRCRGREREKRRRAFRGDLAYIRDGGQCLRHLPKLLLVSTRIRKSAPRRLPLRCGVCRARTAAARRRASLIRLSPQ